MRFLQVRLQLRGQGPLDLERLVRFLQVRLQLRGQGPLGLERLVRFLQVRLQLTKVLLKLNSLNLAFSVSSFPIERLGALPFQGFR